LLKVVIKVVIADRGDLEGVCRDVPIGDTEVFKGRQRVGGRLFLRTPS
jgi:hypothetical protein